MSSALVVAAATLPEVHARIQLIQQVMRDSMIEGVHYGTIPGTPKPSLWKPGAEMLGTLFHIASSYVETAEREPNSVRFSTVCIGTHQGTGVVLGEGLGECSSDETKYRWRAPVCDEEFEETSEDRRREKWARGSNGPYKQKQVRTEAADIANTVKKMAAKRAQVAMILNVTAASDIFSQDLEDLSPEDARADSDAGAPARAARTASRAPRSTGAAGAPGFATPPQQKLIRVKLDQAGMSAEDLCKHFAIDSVTQLPFDKVNAALAFISDPERGAIQGE